MVNLKSHFVGFFLYYYSMANRIIEQENKMIDEIIENLCSRSTYFSSSGGLKGNAWVNRYGHIEALRLEFVLTEWESDGDV